MGSTWRAAKNLFSNSLSTLTSNSNHLQPGTLLSVGDFRVQVIKQLAEGGFAFVYMVKDVQTDQTYALKRLLVNDSEDLAKVKEEIEFMKRIPRHRNIVEFRSAGISQGNQGTEVLIVMEFCPEPSLYEILDQRFKNYFTESEVLEIFSQVCDGVAHLHSLSPPIAHRDLKVENVLKHGNTYKLCDFGSATTKTFLPTNSSSINHIEDELNRYTTPSYRSPEMVDLWRMQQINEKVDIWALGCLLYRICFFFHPFEEGGNLGILNVNYQIPPNSPYSAEVHKFIQFMIEPDPTTRPSIFQVIERLSALRGVPSSVKATSPSFNVTTERERQIVTPSSPAVAKNNAAPTDVFSMLDWHDASGNTSSPSASKSVATQSSTTSHDAFGDFADFSNANFVTSAPSQDFQADTSFFAAATASHQPLQGSQQPTEHSLFPTEAFKEQNTPVAKPVTSQPNLPGAFAAFESPSPPQRTVQSSFHSDNQLFSDFHSPPNAMHSPSSFTEFQTPSPTSKSFDFGERPMNPNANPLTSSGSMVPNQQTNMYTNSMSPSMHTRHSSYSAQGNLVPMRSLFDSVAATPSKSSGSTNGTPTTERVADAFANLRNLV